MPRRIRWLALATAVLAGCATWPNVRCAEEPPNIGTFLDGIERLVELRNPTQKGAILEALFVCRRNAHSGSEAGGALTQEKHCAFVVAAYRWAFREEFGKCLDQLMHGSGTGTPTGPAVMTTNLWPDLLCGELTAREMLEFVRVRLDGPGGLPPGDPLRNKIILEIDQCLLHPANGALLTQAQHCGKVRNAFTEATKPLPGWNFVFNELDHMP